MTYILIMYLSWTSQSGGLTTQEFNSKVACTQAITDTKEAYGYYGDGRIIAICVPKGRIGE